MGSNTKCQDFIIEINDEVDQNEVIYKEDEYNLEGLILIEKDSVEKIVKDNNKMRKKIKKLEKIIEFKNCELDSYRDRYESEDSSLESSFKQFFTNCFQCLD